MKHFSWLLIKILIVFAFICSMGFSECLSAELQKETESTNTSIKPEGVPKIQFLGLSYDFGKTFQGKKLVHLFVFKNIGTSDLLITKVKAG